MIYFNFAQNRTMKNYFWALFAAFFLVSCDDGDLIVTDFSFEDRNVERCMGAGDTQVFYKRNNVGSNEAIALVFQLQPDSETFLINEEGILPIRLNEQNQVIYRTFDSEVGSNYFCSEVPPTAPNVIEEYQSTSGGQIIITSTLRNADDHDQDGVPTSVEQAIEAEFIADDYPDSDGDGIPDYLDIDDDNDNVLTRLEIEVEAESTANGYPDTDSDGIPDYLDTDDDNDGVITRYEDLNENLNPADDVNDEGLPFYRDPTISEINEVDNFRSNTIRRSFRYNVSIEDLTLVRQGGDGEQIRIEDYDFGIVDSAEEPITLEGNEVVDEDEENEGEEE